MQSELIVLSHLRWEWVWQRPQHLVSRVGRDRRTWFVEEPVTSLGGSDRLATRNDGDLTRVWLEADDPRRYALFDEPFLSMYCDQLPRLVGCPEGERIVWLYTPMALPIAEALAPDVLVYDVMDDLASFKDASPALVTAQRAALRRADVVFAGGRSLHRGVVSLGRNDAHLFPSGVDPEHYELARMFDLRGDRPVAGYVGVVDERIDLDLVARLAAELPDWEIRMVGPVTKIDEASLPRAENIVYTGPEKYERLPEVMAGFDVALMPFALNEATRSISPTKTLEYLAAGLPVVSTRVPDVVSDFSSVVDLQDDAAGFAAACRRVREHDLRDRDNKLAPLLHAHRWDTIAERMSLIIEATSAARVTEELPA